MAPTTVVRGPSPLPPETAACLGAFDGLHLGHQALLARARRIARRVALATFDPHPATVLAPEVLRRPLQTPEQRVRVCGHLGIDVLALLPFDPTIAALPPEAFVATMLRGGLRPAAVVVGDDFRFGHHRAGDAASLRRLCAPDIAVEIVPRVPAPPGIAATALGSRAIRALLTAGQVADAARLLGRPYAVVGRVERGAQRGRTLGFPTANVGGVPNLLPANGIYAAALCVVDPASPHHGAIWPGAASLGHNPTFAGDAEAPVALEVHVLERDLGESLYGVAVEVAFFARLRDERRFDQLDDLVEQIGADVEATREIVDDEALARVVGATP